MKRLVVIVVLALGLVSCKKFLAERSQSDVIPKTTKDFGEILYTNGYPTVNTLLQPYLTLMDDDIQCYNSDVLGTNEYATTNAGAFLWQPDFIDYTLKAGNGKVASFNSWGTYYKLILGANVALQYLDKSEGSTTEKNMYKGEAYALRAFYHFMLVNLYAKPYNDSSTTPDKSPGVPIILSANLSDDLPVRQSVKEVYNQVINDMDSAMYLLEQVKSDQKLFRISHVAVHLLASRVYLYMEQWDKSIAHADYVLSYHPQLMDLTTWGDPDVTAKPIIGAGNVETIWYYGDNDESFPMGVSASYDISHNLAACFEPNDLRNPYFFEQLPDFMKMFSPIDYGYTKAFGNSGGGNVYTNNMGSAWRSAEAYLNRAEAYIQLYKTKGDAGAAAQGLISLNTLRAKRTDPNSFVDWKMAPADTLLQMCRLERRRELFHECGHRWFDLRRYGMPAIEHIYTPDPLTTQVYKLNARDPQYVIPIPNEVLLRNTSIPQNPQLTGFRQPQ